MTPSACGASPTAWSAATTSAASRLTLTRTSASPRFLDPFTADNDIVCGGPSVTILDEGTGNPLIFAAACPTVAIFQALEREYLTGRMSLRELCRQHGITAHNAVMVQVRQGGWAEKP